jgi:hypothetical protein
MAHVLGARGAFDLIQTAQSDPSRIAAKDFPDAAAANRGLFYDKTGRARSAQEVYGVLAASHANTQLAAATTATSAAANAVATADKPVEIAAALQPGRAKGLIGLFSTEGSRGPVSSAVANLWTTPRQGGTRLASLEGGERYFPRQTQSDATATTASLAAPATAATPAAGAVVAPLPPSRPIALTQAASSPAVATPANTAQAKPKSRRAPLDLSSFMVRQGGA